MKIKLYAIAGLLLASCFNQCHVVAQQPDAKLARFLEIGEELRVQSGVPGVGIAIVYKNNVLYTGGLGFSNLETQTPVTENTLFSIGSNTKAFTGVLATKLVSRGLLSWDKPLVDYIPELKFKEEYVTKQVTLADALSHRVGLKRSTDVWKNKKLSRTELLGKLAQLEFDSSFRDSFNYNNLMYVVAGIAAERVTGESWEQMIRKEVLDPLGMKDSFVTTKEFDECQQRAIGYHNDGIRPARSVDLTSIAPAGAISSTSKDIANWIKMLLNNGQHEGREFLTKGEYDYMLRPHKNLSLRNEDELWFYYTGLGGFSKNSKRTVGADGAIDGQNSRCVLCLDDGFGIFVMTNRVSEYKALLARYAEQIFLHDNYSRDHEQELQLASRASFDKFATVLLDNGIASAGIEYAQQKFKPSEDLMNQFGSELMANNQIAKALFTLKQNVLSFPESSKAQNSLGDAYMVAKNFDLAKEHYRKSVFLDPKNENAKEKLGEIENQTQEKQ